MADNYSYLSFRWLGGLQGTGGLLVNVRTRRRCLL